MRDDYAVDIERDEQGKAARLVFCRQTAAGVEVDAQAVVRPSVAATGQGVPLQRNLCGQCGSPLTGKQREWCSDRCRFAAWDRAHPRQGSLFDQERPRLSRQCGVILERLARGRTSNSELARIALKYTSRTSDLRKAGHDIRVVGRNRESGLVWYALFIDGQEVTL